MLPIADFGLGEALLTALSIFFFVVWIWILITILSDLFRDHELSGWGKAAWVFFLVFVPFLTALIYLGVRGSGMRDRAIQAQKDAQSQMDEYIRDTAQASPADELHKLQRPEGEGRDLGRRVREDEGEDRQLAPPATHHEPPPPPPENPPPPPPEKPPPPPLDELCGATWLENPELKLEPSKAEPLKPPTNA